MQQTRKLLVSRHWREFEQLSLELIRSELGLAQATICLTPPSKDGGFDGRVLHTLSASDQLDIQHLTLLEAKLRAGVGSIGLRAFAATLVVAFNAAAQTLVLVSNRRFSKQALEHIGLFHWKTNMQVRPVDGPTLSGWIRRYRTHLESMFSSELLDFLMLPNPTQEKFRRVHFHFNLETNQAPRIDSNHRPVGIVEFGWTDDSQMADCRLQLLSTSAQEEVLAELPQSRQRLAAELTSALTSDPGVTLIKGTAGVGKSFLIGKVLSSLLDSQIAHDIIDLSALLTTRQLFLRLLSALYGASIVEALAQGSQEAAVRWLVSRLSGNALNATTTQAIAALFESSSEQYEARKDINAQFLLDFLETISRPHASRRRRIFVFMNLNATSANVLDFLGAACQALTRSGYTTLLELRDSGQTPLLTSTEWEQYNSYFSKLSNLGTFSLGPLTAEEAEQVLATFLPQFGTGRLEVIRRRVGHLPLFLRSAALWLRHEKIVQGADSATVLANLERFFEGISPSNLVTILDNHINVWRDRIDYPFAEAISAASLLGGCLSISVLGKIAPLHSSHKFADRLIETGLFSLDATSPSQLVVVHDLLLERMTYVDQQNPFRRSHTAECLLPHIDILFREHSTRELKRVDLLAAVGAWNQVLPLAIAAGESLESAHDWAMSLHYFELAFLAAQAMQPMPAKVKATVTALLALLELEQHRARLGLPKNQGRLASLQLLITQEGDLEHATAELAERQLRVLLLSWRSSFLQEEFDAALHIAERARELALDFSTEIDKEYRGAALAAVGITLKTHDRSDDSIAEFASAMVSIPESLTVKVESLSNRAALALRDDPRIALTLFEEIETELKTRPYSFQRLVQSKVDIGMAHFLIGNHQRSREVSLEAWRIAEGNGIPQQEARARNIIGCCDWIASKVEQADRHFDFACLAAERALSYRFLWRTRTNRACTAAELGLTSLALETGRSAEQLILRAREKNLASGSSKGFYRARWYIALLALAILYLRVEAITDFERIVAYPNLPDLRLHADCCAAGQVPLELGNTAAFHGTRIVITG